MDVRQHIKAPRYTDAPFPAYRFLPGRDPHPTSDPRGHSYVPPGQPVHNAVYVAPEDWPGSFDYLFACDLYNHGYWWEAHEAWEGLWQLVDKRQPQGRFLKGLIQAGACHLKLHLGNLDGVRRLLARSTGYLRDALHAAPDGIYMGLDVPSFVGALTEYYAHLLGRGTATPEHDPARFPYLYLREHRGFDGPATS